MTRCRLDGFTLAQRHRHWVGTGGSRAGARTRSSICAIIWITDNPLDRAAINQSVDGAFVNLSQTMAVRRFDTRESKDKAGRIGDGEIARIADQVVDAIGLRRMVGEMSPQILIAIEPVSALDPFSKCIHDPALRLRLITLVMVVIGESLMRQAIYRLAVFSRFDNVPAGMSQNPGHVIVVDEAGGGSR
jgi:hypothetical protein